MDSPVVFPPDIEAITAGVPSPCFVVHLGALEDNLRALSSVRSAAGCRMLAALKAYSFFPTFGLIDRYLDGACASGPHEAELARQYLSGEVHCFSPAFSEQDIEEVLPFVDHLVFNTGWQWEQYRSKVAAHSRPVACGLRVNPEHSEGAVPLYDPCAPGSRLGLIRRELDAANLDGISGLHFHTLCEQDSHALARTIQAFEDRFGDLINRLEWVNFGGGHHITRPDYDREHLIRMVRDFRERHGVRVYIEPGEAIALNTGILVATVLDFVENEGTNAILDVSATAHMPDVLEMPYRPTVFGAGKPGEKPYTYRFGGPTCLAGDVIGAYSFDQPLRRGDRIVFGDMAHYTMVKTTFFNGVKHPSLAVFDPKQGGCQVLRSFDYRDFHDRLGPKG